MSTSSTTIKLNLHQTMVKNASTEAKRIGLSLQDFIRMLLGNYFATPVMEKAEYYQKLFDVARKEIREGKYTTIKNSSELKKHLKSL